MGHSREGSDFSSLTVPVVALWLIGQDGFEKVCDMESRKNALASFLCLYLFILLLQWPQSVIMQFWVLVAMPTDESLKQGRNPS